MLNYMLSLASLDGKLHQTRVCKAATIRRHNRRCRILLTCHILKPSKCYFNTLQQAMGALTPKSSAKTALSTNEEERTVNSKVGGS